MGFEIDTSEIEDALNSYQSATGKDMVDVLNRFGRNVAYRAAQNTPIELPAQIVADLKKDPRLIYALTELSLKSRGITHLEKGQLEKEAQALIARRKGSARYLRVGWAQAIIDMGGNFRGAKLERGSHGYGDKATVVNLLAQIAWIVDEPNSKKADSAEQIAIKALEDAIDFVLADMIDYAEKKMADTAKRHSA